MVVVLGLGFTGGRLARRLLAQGVEVFAAARRLERFEDIRATGIRLTEWNIENPESMALPPRALIAWCLPPLPEPDKAALRNYIKMLAPTRIVYVSSTGVYGDQSSVDEHTTPQSTDERAARRIEEEHWISSGPWTALILRAAAIYGPGRGVHASIRQGKIPRGAVSTIVSRIHVDDLVQLMEAGLNSTIEGAWPVADDQPASTNDIAEWCIREFSLPEISFHAETSISGRSVNGTRIRELLGVRLKYPSWQTGIPASITEED
jgi:nucleoside-diphosphate-sugar epimerase